MISALTPRGLLARSVIAAAVFAAAVVPGWLLAGRVEEWTGGFLWGYLASTAYGTAAIAVLAPRCSYRRRDALFGLVPLVGYYVTCVLAWRVALLPFRDWEPRADELDRSRWLDDPGFEGTWVLAGPVPPAPRRSARSGGLRVRGRS